MQYYMISIENNTYHKVYQNWYELVDALHDMLCISDTN